MAMHIGFIGLGNMGRGMAANMLRYCQRVNYDFTVFDLNPKAVKALSAQGAKPATSIAQITKNSDIIFTSLPSSKEVAQIAFGADGLLQNLPETAIWFETSTSDIAKWEAVRSAARPSLRLIDAPVTGGTEGAAAGSLTMLLGLDTPLEAQYHDLLGAIAKKIMVMGPSGAGYIAKLAQLHLNYLVAQGIGEALMLGAQGGLDLGTLSDVLSHSCAQSYVVDNYIPKVLDGSYDDSFALGLAKKDMELITALAQHLNVTMPLGDIVDESYQTAVQNYGFDAPHLSIVKLYEAQTGKDLRA